MSEQEPKTETRVLIRVRARREQGRWRLGKHWPAQPVEAEVTEEQLAILKADDQLIVLDGATRNDSVPTVNEVQPGRDKPPEPEPWGDIQLEKQRKELLELEKQHADDANEERKAKAEAERAEYESKPNDNADRNDRKRRR